MKKIIFCLFIITSCLYLSSCGDGDDDDDGGVCAPFKRVMIGNKVDKTALGFSFYISSAELGLTNPQSIRTMNLAKNAATVQSSPDLYPYYTTTYKDSDIKTLDATCKGIITDKKLSYKEVYGKKYREEEDVCIVDTFVCSTLEEGTYSSYLTTSSSKQTEFTVGEFIKDECKESMVLDNSIEDYSRIKFTTENCIQEPVARILRSNLSMNQVDTFATVQLNNSYTNIKVATKEELFNTKFTKYLVFETWYEGMGKKTGLR